MQIRDQNSPQRERAVVNERGVDVLEPGRPDERWGLICLFDLKDDSMVGVPKEELSAQVPPRFDLSKSFGKRKKPPLATFQVFAMQKKIKGP